MRKMIITAGLTSLLATTVLAQGRLTRSQEEEVLEVIAAVGGTCEDVSRTQAIGQLDNRNTLMAVACTGGEQYVILLDRRARMTFYSTCDALAEANNNLIRCFG